MAALFFKQQPEGVFVKIVAMYSHKGGKEFMEKNHSAELKEILAAIEVTNAEKCRTKSSKESTMKDLKLYSPVELNKAIKADLYPKGWAEKITKGKNAGKYREKRVTIKTKVPETGQEHTGDRAMDGLKNKVGLEIQFGKYAFMGYDILAKMPIFKKRDLIEVGVEIVPMKALATGRGAAILPLIAEVGSAASEEAEGEAEEKHDETNGQVANVSEKIVEEASAEVIKRMSTGVSYYEQIKADLEARGEADLDIPVLIIGVEA